MADPWPQASAGLPLLLVILLLVPASLLAGCISQPTTELTVRPGDLIRADIGVVRANTSQLVFPPEASCPQAPPFDWSACTLTRQAYVVSDQLPATLPPGWQEARALPPGLVDLLEGRGEGASLHSGDVLAYGERSPELVEEHPREVGLPRVVPNASAYGRAWNTTTLEDGQERIEPAGGDRYTLIEAPRWCNARFCLFHSELVDWNATHLIVRHAASAGDRVDVAELGTHLEVVRVGQGTVTVDGNDPRAGQRYDVHVQIETIRGPPEGQRRAPSFELTTLEGEQVELAGFQNQVLVLEFFASWCPSCRKNTEHLSRIQDRFGDQVAILAIDVDPWESGEQLQAFIRENEVTWPIALDQTGQVQRDYRVGSLSTEVIVHRGAIVHTETGVADHDRVAGVIGRLLENAPPTGDEGDTP